MPMVRGLFSASSRGCVHSGVYTGGTKRPNNAGIILFPELMKVAYNYPYRDFSRIRGGGGELARLRSRAARHAGGSPQASFGRSQVG